MDGRHLDLKSQFEAVQGDMMRRFLFHQQPTGDVDKTGSRKNFFIVQKVYQRNPATRG